MTDSPTPIWFISGCSTGFGRALAEQVLARGWRAVVTARQQASVEPLATRHPDTALALALDVTRPEQVTAAVAAVEQRFGGIDVLVNNAGWSVPGFIATDTDRDKWQRTIEINLFTAIAATQAAIPPMKAAGGGALVFIASDAAFGQIRQGVYGASKAAMVALARTTAREHGRHGIRSNIVCPGLVIPDGPDAVGADSLWSVGQDNVFNQDQIDYMVKDTPLRRLTTAEDVGRAVLWFSSPRAARQVTGQMISVSGGYTMP